MAVRIALGSAAIGSFFGWVGNNYYDSWKLRGNNERLWYTQEIPRKPGLPLYGTVSAATPFKNENLVSRPPGESSPDPKRVFQIMKYGFPNLDNIRYFEDFVLSYDRRNRVAHWVFEHITKESCQSNPEVDRSQSEFTPDNSIHEFFRSSNEDYFKSGFDRGHLAAAGNHKANQRFCDETFILSNISPQVDKFNRESWNNLERYVRKLTKKYKNVYVCSGPLYLPKKEADGKSYVRYQVLGKNHVAVPTHFFKIVVAETPTDELHMQSYVMPNQVIPADTPLSHFLVPVESVERAAGLLFFDKISRDKIKVMNGKMLTGGSRQAR